jgi:hypothetical protein
MNHMTIKRECGDCQLCCRLVPLDDNPRNARPWAAAFQKPANTKCPHQRYGCGCSIYPTRPLSCQLWNCRWLKGEDTGSRPDRAHYVVDVMPDWVIADDGDGEQEVQVIQIWIDPKHPNAHRDPKLRAYIETQNLPALVRNGNDSAVFLVPPLLSRERQWIEKTSEMTKGPAHTAEEYVKRYGMPDL